jgi:Ca2+-transporting ATPase
MEWHNKSKDECYLILESDPKGLTQEEAHNRLIKNGSNQIAEEKPINKMQIFLAQIKNPIIYIILITAIITFIFQKYSDTIVIGIVVIFNTLIGFLQEYKAETSLKALKSMVNQDCTILRPLPYNNHCSQERIDARLTVPGDILLLESGDKIPADGRIINSINLEINESMLTGESNSVKKISKKLNKHTRVAERRNMIYAGTIVTKGRGKAIIVETGMNTEIGKIADLIQSTENEKSPIQNKVLKLVKFLLFVALFSSMFTFLMGFLQGIEIYEMFFFAVASAISAIPEGLPVVLTITLAIGVNKMAKRKAIIRKLTAVDTLGAATIICSDKTGTLTTNKMTAVQIYVDNQFIDVSKVGYNLEGIFKIRGKEIELEQVKTLELLLHTATLCNNASLGVKRGKKTTKIGDPTELALLGLSAKKEISKASLEEKKPRIDEIPFDSSAKYMVTFHQNNYSSEKVDVYIKGAPEIVLKLCSHIYINGEILDLTEKKMQEIMQDQQLRLMVSAKSVLRNLAFAHQIITVKNIKNFKKSIKNGEKVFNFIGLVGMIDPPRPGVKESIHLCKKAGIKVIMATGDHKLTAEAIGNEIGIHQEDSFIITGEQLSSMSEKELDDKIDNTDIFARVSPEDKYKIVSSLKRKNHIICMTGDGVNDAPALKAADVGVAMGITGTDVSKEASEMVLSDDDFSSIVSAVEEGRVIFQNVRKVIKYLISTNIAEDLVILLSLLLFPIIFGDLFLIFTPVQILWVNLVTDGILDVTLAMEGKESDVMAQSPRPPNEPIFNREILLNILFIGTLMMLGTICMYVFGMNEYNSRVKAQTIAFTTMAMFQVFNSLNCRSRNKSVFKLGFFTNKYLMGSLIISIFLQICAVYLFFFNALLGTTPISLFDWLLIISITSSVFIGDELRKFIKKKDL